jgi:hypothetical protein
MSTLKSWANRSVGRGERPETRRKVMKTVNRMALLGTLTLAGCTADFAKNGNGSVLLLITGVNGGKVLQSDVEIGGGICPDTVFVRVENKPKNPNILAIDYRGDIVIERYEVRYSRSDGRATQGVDVPYSISGNLAAEVIFLADANVPVQVVRDQAKLEPPLMELRDSGGQALIVSMFAEITLYGRTTIGEAVTAKGSMQIDFSDFADQGTSATCPTTN